MVSAAQSGAEAWSALLMELQNSAARMRTRMAELNATRLELQVCKGVRCCRTVCAAGVLHVLLPASRWTFHRANMSAQRNPRAIPEASSDPRGDPVMTSMMSVSQDGGHTVWRRARAPALQTYRCAHKDLVCK